MVKKKVKKLEQSTFDYPQSLEVDMFDYIVQEEADPLYVWETKGYQAILIKDLRTDHIVNIIKVMDAKPYWRADQRPILVAELKRRQIEQIKTTTENGVLIYE